MRRQERRIYEFANFRLDVGERVLSRDGEIVSLRPKLFDLLVFLIGNRGQVLEKDEITRAVWGSRSQGSPESPSANLNVNISNLRHELGDGPEKPAFIETVKGRGYRFIPLVRVIESSTDVLTHDVAATPFEQMEDNNGFDPEAPATQNEETSPASPANERRATTHRLALVAAAAVVLTTIVAWTVTNAVRNHDGAETDTLVEKSSSGAGNSPGGQFAGSQTGDSSAASPRVFSLEPATPSAWIGDKPIRVYGKGFRSGLTVTMVFPSGGSASLSGIQVLNVTDESFTLIADFNNNPGEYRIRVNNPEGRRSDWMTFDVLPISLLPEIIELKQGAMANGLQRIRVTGRNFQQGVSSVLVYPDGQVEYPQTLRISAESFYALFDPRGQTGPFRLRAQNAGKESNVVSFDAPKP